MIKKRDLNDKQVIRKIRSGQIEYFELLVKKYSAKFYLYAKNKVKNSQDAEDIIQNSFIKLYKVIDKFDETKEFSPYFYSIVNSQIAQFYRDNPRHSMLDEDIGIPGNMVEESTSFQDLLRPLRQEYKNALQLYIEGFSYKEISQKLNKPLNTVKTLIRRAKLEVKKNSNVK